jgi:hypothetical protein
MSENINRRSFLGRSLTATTGAAALGFSFEEKVLLAHQAEAAERAETRAAVKGLPMGKIGDRNISRVICGSNLFGGGAHARELQYVSRIVRNYHTEEKIMETLQLCEENGINTNVGAIGAVNEYNRERGGKMQVIGQLGPSAEDPIGDAQEAIDGGAIGAFIWGKRSEDLVQANRLDVIEKFASFLQKNGAIAGVGAHDWRVVAACEKAGINLDFYFKTIHHDNYWSAYPKDTRRPFRVDSFADDDKDCMWEQFPEETIELMKTVKKPWIGYKVLAAGAIHPTEGFKFAFAGGADFVCAGMFDFQVREDVLIAKKMLADDATKNRARPWA